MKIKFALTNIWLQVMIFISSGFIVLTQMNSTRQPTKLLVCVICVLSLLALIINIYNYVKEDKD